MLLVVTVSELFTAMISHMENFSFLLVLFRDGSIFVVLIFMPTYLLLQVPEHTSVWWDVGLSCCELRRGSPKCRSPSCGLVSRWFCEIKQYCPLAPPAVQERLAECSVLSPECFHHRSSGNCKCSNYQKLQFRNYSLMSLSSFSCSMWLQWGERV